MKRILYTSYALSSQSPQRCCISEAPIGSDVAINVIHNSLSAYGALLFLVAVQHAPCCCCCCCCTADWAAFLTLLYFTAYMPSLILPVPVLAASPSGVGHWRPAYRWVSITTGSLCSLPHSVRCTCSENHQARLINTL